MLKPFFLIFAIFTSGLLQGTPEVQVHPSSESVLKELIAGNDRYINDRLSHPNRSQERRETIALGQDPLAVIVGCSDSRVVPEIIFDQGLGDLFVVRTAGNVIGPIGLSSVQYGAGVLHATLIMVLGHESCGAVKAVLAGQGSAIEPIAKQVEESLRVKMLLSENPIENAIKLNVLGVVNKLKNDPALHALIAAGKLEIVGGYYNLESGKVEICCGLENKSETAKR